jgi:uncharacterized protein (TIGR00297 family)
MMMLNDVSVLMVLGVSVGILAVSMELLARRRVLPQWLCRKVLHLGAVGACAGVPLLLRDLTALTIIVAVAEVLLFGLVWSRVLFREADGRPSWGIALFPLPYLALLLLYPAPEQRTLIVLPMLILAVSDALAAVIGTLATTPSYTLTGDRKTVGGSLTFVLSTWLILAIFPGPLNALPFLPQHGAAVLFALVLAASEALGSNGRDNLYIPSVAALLLVGLSFRQNELHLLPAVAALPFAAAFVVITVRKHWLTLGGAVAAALLGVWVILFQGLLWLTPLMVFFVGSTLLGRVLRARGRGGDGASDAKHGQPRDATQVFANGGIYGLAAALLPTADAQFIMALSMTAATADTWASEIGIALKGRTYDIVGLRPVPVGLSGGVSLGGTLGAAVGALMLACLGAMLIESDVSPWAMTALLTGLGLASMLLDSVLGSLLQAKYRGPGGALQDSDAEGAMLVRGSAWVSNDAVNLMSNLVVAGLALWWMARDTV